MILVWNGALLLLKVNKLLWHLDHSLWLFPDHENWCVINIELFIRVRYALVSCNLIETSLVFSQVRVGVLTDPVRRGKTKFSGFLDQTTRGVRLLLKGNRLLLGIRRAKVAWLVGIDKNTRSSDTDLRILASGAKWRHAWFSERLLLLSFVYAPNVVPLDDIQRVFIFVKQVVYLVCFIDVIAMQKFKGGITNTRVSVQV